MLRIYGLYYIPHVLPTMLDELLCVLLHVAITTLPIYYYWLLCLICAMKAKNEKKYWNWFEVVGERACRHHCDGFSVRLFFLESTFSKPSLQVWYRKIY